jgi:hypothetical protein
MLAYASFLIQFCGISFDLANGDRRPEQAIVKLAPRRLTTILERIQLRVFDMRKSSSFFMLNRKEPTATRSAPFTPRPEGRGFWEKI